jgi:transmembrane sensor
MSRRRSAIVDAAWCGWVESVTSNDEKVRAAIAEQAAEWLVANDEGPLDTAESAALTAWLKTSPVHIEEFLGVSVIARDLREAGTDAEYSFKSVLARARAEDESPVHSLWPRLIVFGRSQVSRGWLTAAVTAAGLGVASLGLFSWWSVRPTAPVPAPDSTAALYFATGHGGLLERRLTDGSVLHLDTDSAVMIRFGRTERLVTLTAGQADFEVAHDPARAFRVFAGSAEVVAVGTKFDVRLQEDSTVVTVVEGQVAVGLSRELEKPGTNPRQNGSPRFVQVGTDQQIRVAAAEWPATPIAVDAQQSTGWLHRQVVFDHEPLARVVDEFNRYAPKPIDVVTPTLRNLQISGAFATDDTEAFIAFLRTLKGVRIEVTATVIRVYQD